MMKHTVRILTAIAAAALLTVSASAQGTGAKPPVQDKTAEPIPVIAEGMTALPVTSSIADSGEDTAVLFDHDTTTGLSLTYEAESETKTFTLRTASGIPQALSSFALVTSSGDGTMLTVRVWGTNDSTEKEWTPLTMRSPVTRTGEWRVFRMTEPEGGWEKAEKYAFYRIELTAEEGGSFTFSECLLIRPVTSAPELFYVTADVVEEGQTPPVAAVSIPAEPSVLRRARFGLFFPGIMK